MRLPTIPLACSLTLFAAACGTESTEPGDDAPPIHLPPDPVPPVFNVPGGGGPSAFTGGFTFTGPVAPGSAAWTDAPVMDIDSGGGPEPDTFGGGSMSITINGTLYDAPTLESIAFVFTDDTGTQYAALDGYTLYDNGGVEYASEAVVIVLASDVTVPGTVELDGVDRVALFANGPADADNPTLVGAAVTGTVTFSAGSIASGVLTGSVAGDFGQIDYVPTDPPTGSITAGSYTLALGGGSDVYCDGTLAGQEAAFAGITAADLGLIGGAVDVATPSPDSVELSGAPVTSAFGASPFALDLMDEGLYAGFTTETGSGPLGTSFAGKYVALDGGSASPTFINASVGAGYYTDDGAGTCTVAFIASLTAP